jgi:hypothetical protein
MEDIKFGLKYKNHITPKVVVFWGKMIKRIAMTAAGANVVMENPYLALSFLIAGGIADELLDYFGVEQNLAG